MVDYDELSGVFTWKSDGRKHKCGDVVGSDDGSGYLRVMINKRKYRLHRLAWLYVHGEWPIGFMDHINRVRDDNRISNLRDVSPRANTINRSLQSNNRSGRVGVVFRPRSGNWCAVIKINGVQIALGTYKEFDDAVKAREEAEAFYFNEEEIYGQRS